MVLFGLPNEAVGDVSSSNVPVPICSKGRRGLLVELNGQAMVEPCAL